MPAAARGNAVVAPPPEPAGTRFRRALASRSVSEGPYNRSVKIYTRTGDTGETSYFDGTRVRKDDPRLATYGDVDELNAWLGLVRASRIDADLDEALQRIQHDLFAMGAQLADPGEKLSTRVAKAIIDDSSVARLEELIDGYERTLPELRKFILPGGTSAGASLHVARTICRRAERRIVSLAPPADTVLLRYINRLSDLLFVLARVANHRGGLPDAEW